MKLYTKPGACSTADHIVLNWSGLPYEVELVKDLKSPEYLKINPAGAVPVFTEGDWMLTQNVAIFHYISDLAPQAKLFGDGTPRQAAEVGRWLSFINADIHPTFKPIFGAPTYLPEDQQTLVKDHARKVLRGLFGRLDEQLKSNDYLAGFLSPADAYAFVVLRWAKAVHVDLSGFDALERFYVRLGNNTGVRDALAAEGLS